MKWHLVISSVIANLFAAGLLGNRMVFVWPPGNVPPLGVAPYVLALTGLVLGIAAIAMYRRKPGSRHAVLLLSAVCAGFSAFCLWLMLDYPNAHDRFAESHSAQIKADLERYARESERTQTP